MQIIIRDLEKPTEKTLENDIEWICESLGFYEKIDKEKTAAQIFKKILESTVKEKKLTSSKLGEESNVTRGAALHHLKRMMNSGIITKKGRNYCLRRSSLYNTIIEIHEDIDRIFRNLESIAKEIDDRIGIKRRE